MQGIRRGGGSNREFAQSLKTGGIAKFASDRPTTAETGSAYNIGEFAYLYLRWQHRELSDNGNSHKLQLVSSPHVRKTCAVTHSLNKSTAYS